MTDSGSEKRPPIVITPPSWLWIVLIGIAAVIVFGSMLLGTSARQPVWSLTEVSDAAKDGEIIAIDVANMTDMTVKLADGRTVYSSKDPSSSAIEQVAALGVSEDELSRIEWSSNSGSMNAVINACLYATPLAIIFVGIIIFLRRYAKYQPPEPKA